MKKNIKIPFLFKELLPKRFFDLEKCLCADLFLMEEPVWETLKLLKSYLKSKILGKIKCDILPSVTLINANQITIEEGSVIEPGAYIEGPCKIGRKCIIRHGAYIRSFVLIGEECVVGHGSEIKHSILLNHARASHFNYVGDSIIGNGVNLGAGAICANVRLDKKKITIKIEKEYIETEMQKMGAIVGDGSQIGCNSVINPGVLLRKKTISKPCVSIQRSNIVNNAKSFNQYPSS